ncbi:MAG: hypothetical protein AAF183_13030 [Pseudomonadota bacterium]
MDGTPGQVTEIGQASRLIIGGETVRENAYLLDGFLDALQGGVSLAALWDSEMRVRNGWQDAISGAGDAELFWTGGAMADEAGASRSVLGLGSVVQGSTSLSLSGLLANEVCPAGTWVRAGDFRYRTMTNVVADGSGAAALTLSRPAVTSEAARYPGDFVVGQLVEGDIGQSDENGVRQWSMTFVEIYEAEVDGGFVYL